MVMTICGGSALGPIVDGGNLVTGPQSWENFSSGRVYDFLG